MTLAARTPTKAPRARSRPRDEVAEARVDSLNYDGRGVARVDGKTTFIDGALPGERVRFRYEAKRRRYDTGSMVEVLEPSPERVAAPCRYAGRCGGCSLQHLSPSAQIAAKQQVLADNLAHIGRVAPARWLPAMTGPDLGYRRRARLGVRNVPQKGGVLVGFREKHHSYITPLEACLTLDPRLSVLLPDLRAVIARLGRPDRIPQVEVAAGDDAVALIVRHLEPLSSEDLEHLRTLAQAHAVQVHLQPEGPESMHVLWPDPAPVLRYRLPDFDLQLAFAPTDFVQINAPINQQLVRSAIELLAIGAHDTVLDLYCGMGNFTLAAARRAARAVGLEGNADLVERARANAQANGLANVEFRAIDLYREPAAAFAPGFRFDRLLLDPPRTGAMEVIKALPPDEPSRIVYISCYPATLARDSGYLVHSRGYRLEAAGVADMFPHTAHVESIALFIK